MIAQLSEDAKNDAKGSAGDKHETALSMMHLEQEKLSNKLREAIAHKAVLDKISQSEFISKKIIPGSLVTANGIYLYISAALPKISVDKISVIALSPQSPLGEMLKGNEAGFTFDINGTKYEVQSVA